MTSRGQIADQMVILNSAVDIEFCRSVLDLQSLNKMAPGLTPIDQSASRITAEQVIMYHIAILSDTSLL